MASRFTLMTQLIVRSIQKYLTETHPQISATFKSHKIMSGICYRCQGGYSCLLPKHPKRKDRFFHILTLKCRPPAILAAHMQSFIKDSIRLYFLLPFCPSNDDRWNRASTSSDPLVHTCTCKTGVRSFRATSFMLSICRRGRLSNNSTLTFSRSSH